MKIVMLEGVIMALAANVLGITVGNLISYQMYRYLNMFYGMKYSVSWLGMLMGLILSIAVLCGSVYVPMRQMKQNLATDLMASGE